MHAAVPLLNRSVRSKGQPLAGKSTTMTQNGGGLNAPHE